MFNVNNKGTRTMILAFKIFDSIRDTLIRVHSKICVSGKVGDVVKKSYKK